MTSIPWVSGDCKLKGNAPMHGVRLRRESKGREDLRGSCLQLRIQGCPNPLFKISSTQKILLSLLLASSDSEHGQEPRACKTHLSMDRAVLLSCCPKI